MRPTKEQLACAVALVAAGGALLLELGRSTEIRKTRQRQVPELPRYESAAGAGPAAAGTRAPAADSPVAGGAARDLFAPPSNTRALPPLELREPPRPELAWLAPPPEPGPAPRHWGRWLAATPGGFDVPDLFAAAVEETELDREELSALDGAPRAAEVLGDALRALEDLGYVEVRVVGSGAGAPDAPGTTSPGARRSGQSPTALERAAAIERSKALYDWIQLNEVDYHFGAIQNPERFRLGRPERAAEPIVFLEIDPESGRERFPGQEPVPYERARVSAFGFARTPANELERRLVELEGTRPGAPLSPGQFEPAAGLARWCLDVRHEAPRALAVAEDLYRRLAAADPGDPKPLLGLGRCLELGFQLERALATYQEMQARFDHLPELHVRLSEIYERLLLDGEAARELELALQNGAASAEAQALAGRRALAALDGERAALHYERALRALADDPTQRAARAALRADLGRARLLAGELARARDDFLLALAAEPANQIALAGLAAVHLLDPEIDPGPARALFAGPPAAGSGASTGASPGALGDWLAALAAAAGLEPESAAGDGGGGLGAAGFELALAAGLASLERGDWTEALRRLESAADADPLRASVAWRALAWLALATGHREQALAYLDQALENDPRDPYAHYLRGRMLVGADDLDAAASELSAVLDVDVDCVDALAALADVNYRRGEHESAERYLERATALAPERAELHDLRGLVALQRSDWGQARASFEGALALAPAAGDLADPLALAGLAWCSYREGDPSEALVQLAGLDDRRRGLAQDDPWRVWARSEQERLAEHLRRVVWSDRFERGALRNQWFTEEAAGASVALAGGVVRVEGTFDRKGDARVLREIAAGQFVALEASVWIDADAACHAGLVVSRERKRGSERDVQSEVRVSRHREGALQVRFAKGGESSAVDADVPGQSFPTGRWVRLRIEVEGQESDARVNVFADGIPLRTGVAMPGLARGSQALLVGLFVEGDPNRRAGVGLDDVELTYREAR